MAISYGPPVPALDHVLAAHCRDVDFPTFGHYLEQGFCSPGLRRMAGSARLIGRAITVAITPTDSTLLHHVVSLVDPGDVVVVDCGGDRRHAPLGEVVVNALLARGAAGAVVDGMCTDIDALRSLGMPVYARGTCLLTTKLHGLDEGSLNVPVSCGGVTVTPGDMVLGDANGLLIIDPGTLAGVLDECITDDRVEPALIDKIRAGERLGDLTGATDLLRGVLPC